MRNVACMVLLMALGGAAGCATDASIPRPQPIQAPAARDVRASIDRGVAFLIESQNEDGSWGSATRTKGLNIYAPIPGAHHGFRAAVTALSTSALIEVERHEDAQVQRAIDQAQAWLLANLPRVKRADVPALYNVWAHSYSLQALVRLRARDQRHQTGSAVSQLLDQQINQQIDRLVRYEFLGGGWGYYDFYSHTQKPAGMSTSFVTATGLIALHEARQAGFDVPQGLIDRAFDSVKRQQKPDFSYLYSETHKYRPMHPVNRPAGSLGRSQACNAAMHLWGDEAVTEQVLINWLDRLFARNGWLSNGRKRPIPHEAPFAVAGYFYYYGHYYAGYCIDMLPPERRDFYHDHMAHTLLPLQETDGSWWDYPLYNYHQPYGTAFALMTLQRGLTHQTTQLARP